MTDNIQAFKDERERSMQVVQDLNKTVCNFYKWLNEQVMVVGASYDRVLVEFSYDANLEPAPGYDEAQCYKQFDEGKRPGRITARVRSIGNGSIELTEDFLDKITEKKLELYREAKRVVTPAKRDLYVARQVADNARRTCREAEVRSLVEDEEYLGFTSQISECPRPSF